MDYILLGIAAILVLVIREKLAAKGGMMEIPNDKIPCHICGRDDSARIREIELSVARHTLHAHVDCDFGHGQYRGVSREEVDAAVKAQKEAKGE